MPGGGIRTGAVWGAAAGSWRRSAAGGPGEGTGRAGSRPAGCLAWEAQRRRCT